MGEPGKVQDGIAWGLLLFSAPFLIIGGLGVAQALGYGNFLGRALVPNWVFGMATSVFLFGGLAFAVQAFGVSANFGQWFGIYVCYAIAGVFTYIALADSSAWIMRTIVIAIDILVIVGTLDWMWGKYSGVESPMVERMEGMKAGEQKVFGIVFLGAPVVIAIVLQATGALDVLAMKMLRTQQRAAGMPAELFKHGALGIYESRGRPARALAEFGGWWDSTGNWYTDGWVGRVIVRIEGDKATLNLWRYCPPNHCNEGNFPAIVESGAGGVLGLHAKGKKDGMDWVVSLRSDPNLKTLNIDERHIRGRDWNTHQQQTRGLTKVK